VNDAKYRLTEVKFRFVPDFWVPITQTRCWKELKPKDRAILVIHKIISAIIAFLLVRKEVQNEVMASKNVAKCQPINKRVYFSKVSLQVTKDDFVIDVGFCDDVLRIRQLDWVSERNDINLCTFSECQKYICPSGWMIGSHP
jgi:hypothetical protein